ncbi:MAG: hypothetical protein QW505_03450 [Thermoplasmata archaeon]
MLKRLNSYVQSNPRNATRILAVLAISLILIAFVLVAQAMNISRYFGPPYPNDTDSPLSLNGNSIIWTQRTTIIYGNPGYGQKYSDIHLAFAYPDGVVGGKAVCNETQEQQLSAGSSATIRYTLVKIIDGNGATVFSLNISVTDVSGDGKWGIEDFIAFEPKPLMEDTTYTIGYAWVTSNASEYAEFSFAIHDGKSYSWHSETLPTENPWWE